MADEGVEEMVEEEFSVWKKNTPLLYDLVALEWPSLTVQWLLSPPSDEGPLTVEIVQKIHDGEVNRTWCMPRNQGLVAAKTSGSEVYVFKCTKQLVNTGGGSCNPDLRLRGHDKEEYGLSWSPFKGGYLLSGSNDCKICSWDVSAMPQDKILKANMSIGFKLIFSSTSPFVLILVILSLRYFC
ncbi:WD-40 repeat-containing MSI2-like [Olea europaea subsp. europaea]|uniref:WD-40 repeat-containing MSI2-like n=1 Tax=Olea europaea subsp. europaea TaxID=158383 RepID=A0A8S0UZ04_OLEEU|nr:WD-40 repeat-containing MSI2-like [Olea europaea subsp. europaea]